MISWNTLNAQQKINALRRPALKSDVSVEQAVEEIISEVQTSGDKALLDYAIKFDKRISPRLLVPVEEIDNSEQALNGDLKNAIDLAYSNIKAFHQAQLPSNKKLTTTDGVECELRYQAISAVGLYVPGGSAPLPSSVLMQRCVCPVKWL